MPSEDGRILLDLLHSNTDESTDLQLSALEQLCFLILQVDSVDTLKKLYPPASYIPLIANFFLDIETESSILESAARVFTYYLQILPFETTACIVDQESLFYAMTLRMNICDLQNQIENDLAQQTIKLLEEYARRDVCVSKLIGCLHNIYGFILSNWSAIHLDTLISGLYVVGRLSNFIDVWIGKQTEQGQDALKESEAFSSCSDKLQNWISKLVGLVQHNDVNVTCGSLESLRNILMSCRRLSSNLNPLDKVTENGCVLDSLLSLLTPMPSNQREPIYQASSETEGRHEIIAAEETAGGRTRRQLSESQAHLVVDLVLSICYQQPSVLKSLIKRPISHDLLGTVLKRVETERGHFGNSADASSMTPKILQNSPNIGSEMVMPILNLIDGLVHLSLTMPAESEMGSTPGRILDDPGVGLIAEPAQPTSALSSNSFTSHESIPSCSQSLLETQRPVITDMQLKQSYQQWKDYIKLRTSIIQGHEGSPGAFSVYFSPLVANGLSAFRSVMDTLGLSNDTELASLRFHLALEHAIIHKVNIVDILTALTCVQLKSCWLDLMGQSLLSWAVHYQYPAAMMALCNRGADPNAGLTSTPLHVAASGRQVAAVKYLLNLKHRSLGLSVNPCLRDIQGLKPRERCAATGEQKEDSLTSELLRAAEEDFKQQYSSLSESVVGRWMALVLPTLLTAYRTSMRPLVRLQAMRIIVRICRSQPGYALLHLLAEEQSRPRSFSERTMEKDLQMEGLTDQILDLVSSAISQGCTAEVLLALSLIPSVIDHAGFREGMRRHGIADFLAWRISVESQLVTQERKSDTQTEWTAFLPTELTDPRVIEDAYSGESECPRTPQCLYELSRGQPYQFGDWTLLRTDTSSLVAIQEFALLWIEVIFKKLTETPQVLEPVIIAYLVTRPDGALEAKQPSLEQENDRVRREVADGLQMKIFMLEKTAGESLLPAQDIRELWLKCVPLIHQIRGCTSGIVPLPLARSSVDFAKKTVLTPPSRTAALRSNRRLRATSATPKMQRPTPRSQNSQTEMSDTSPQAVAPVSVATATTTPTSTSVVPVSLPLLDSLSVSCTSVLGSPSGRVSEPVSDTTVVDAGQQQQPVSTEDSFSDASNLPPTLLEVSDTIRTMPSARTNEQSPGPHHSPTLNTKLMTSTLSTETEESSEVPSSRELIPSQLSAGLLTLTLGLSGLSISLRAQSAQQMEIGDCGHLECIGAWDPDFEVQTPKDGFLEEGMSHAAAAAAAIEPQPQRTVAFTPGLAKVIVAPTKVGGIRFYGDDGMLVQRVVSLARSARLSRLHPVLAPLSLQQRQELRNCHRRYHLRKLRECVVTSGSEILRLLGKENPRESLPHISPSYRFLWHAAALCQAVVHELDLVEDSTQLEGILRRLDSAFLAGVSDSEKHGFVAIATPHEMLASGIVPALSACLKLLSEDSQVDVKFYDGRKIGEKLPPALFLLKTLFGCSLPIFIRKVVKTLEMIERYPVTALHFTGLHEQLLQQSVQLQPRLSSVAVDRLPEQTDKHRPFCRRVDLSTYRLYAAPLATFGQIQQWLLTRMNEVPWYMDVLPDMGFIYDLRQPDHKIFVLPATNKVCNASDSDELIDLGPNVQIYRGGIFQWLSTNGGREPGKRINPIQLKGLIRISTSDATINRRASQLNRLILSDIDDRETTMDASKAPPRSSSLSSASVTVNNDLEIKVAPPTYPWIAIDLGVYIHLTHYGLRVPMVDKKWPSLQHWQLLGSKCGISWSLLAEHHIHPKDDAEAYWGKRGERIWSVRPKPTPYHDVEAPIEGHRFFKLICLPSAEELNTVNQSSMRHRLELTLRGIEFYGQVLRSRLQEEPAEVEEINRYIMMFKPGVFVVPNKLKLNAASLRENWPPESEVPPESTAGNTEEAIVKQPRVETELTTSEPLGVILSVAPKDKRITVAWFQPIPSNFKETLVSETRIFIESLTPSASDRTAASAQLEANAEGVGTASEGTGEPVNSRPPRVCTSFPSQVKIHHLSSISGFDIALPSSNDQILKRFIEGLDRLEHSTTEEHERQCENVIASLPLIGSGLNSTNLTSQHANAFSTNQAIIQTTDNYNNSSTKRRHTYSVIEPSKSATLTPSSRPQQIMEPQATCTVYQRKRPWFVYKFPGSTGGWVIRAEGENTEASGWEDRSTFFSAVSEVDSLEAEHGPTFEVTSPASMGNNSPSDGDGGDSRCHTFSFAREGTNNSAIDSKAPPVSQPVCSLAALEPSEHAISEAQGARSSAACTQRPSSLSLGELTWVPAEGQPVRELPFRASYHRGHQGDPRGPCEGTLAPSQVDAPDSDLVIDFDRFFSLTLGGAAEPPLPRVIPILEGPASATCAAPIDSQPPTTKIASLDAILPGFIPPFDTRSGANSQPTTVSFDVAGVSSDSTTAASTASVTPRWPKIWLRPNAANKQQQTEEPGFIGPLLPDATPMAADLETDAERGWAYYPKSADMSLCNCWMDNIQLTEEFPGCGKPNRCGTPFSSAWQKGFILHYSLDNCHPEPKLPLSANAFAPKSIEMYSLVASMPFFIHSPQDEDCHTTETVTSTSHDLTEQLLHLLRALHTLTTSSKLQSEGSVARRFQCTTELGYNRVTEYPTGHQPQQTERHKSSYHTQLQEEQSDFFSMLPCPEELFHSARLASKLHTFTNSAWSVIQASGRASLSASLEATTTDSPINAGMRKGTSAELACSMGGDMYSWCRRLTQEVEFLFPFETRLDFWRATSLGISRSVAWLQKRLQIATQALPSGLGSVHRNTSTAPLIVDSNVLGSSTSTSARFSASDFGSIWGISSVLKFPRMRKLVRSPSDPPSRSSTTSSFSSASSSFPSAQRPINRSPFSSVAQTHPNLSPHALGNSSSSSNRASLTGLGRIQREFAKVPRPVSDCADSPGIDLEKEPTGDDFWETAKALLCAHAGRKQELEIGFENEEGTGLGPTMEFYALLSAELRKKAHALWVADYSSVTSCAGGLEEDNKKESEKEANGEMEVDPLLSCLQLNAEAHNNRNDCENTPALQGQPEHGEKDETATMCQRGRGAYVTPKIGLFPSAWPADSLPPGTEERFFCSWNQYCQMSTGRKTNGHALFRELSQAANYKTNGTGHGAR
uniref:E3 ubiquitin-protein ligase n=1 Tax=Schistocephalus solidus TaxID=70667 RepID=A0A0X3QHG7_SCHSO